MNRTRLLLALVMGSLIGTFFALDLGRYLTLDALQAQQAAVAQWVDSHFVSASLLFVLIYVLSTALSLPGASLLTLGGSAVFGVAWGLLLVSFASTIGATLAFLSARFLLRDWVTVRFGDKLATFQSGMAKEGAFYLLSLRLIPIFPFFLVNLLMGLTPIRVSTYYWVSQLGMLPGTFVYVLAGSELGQLTSTGNILSPGLMVALTLLGLMPWLVKKLTAHLAQRRLLTPYRKPARYDYNLLVIGAGAGGLVTSYIAAAVKAKVALIEKHKMGGDCLNSGCVPSKALIRSARFAAEQRKADELGFSPSHSRADFAAVMERVAEVIKEVEPHDSIERYQGLGVECIEGEARLVSPWEVEVNGQRLASRHIVIATGARPLVPKLPGLEQVPYLTSDSLWQLRTPPRRLLVLGGGPIGCELAQSFALLGIPVTLVELSEQLLPREDREVADALAGQMSRDGVQLLTGWRAERADYLPAAEGDLPIRLQLRRGDETQVVEGDQLLLALGRVANVSGFGLEALGVELAPPRHHSGRWFSYHQLPQHTGGGRRSGPLPVHPLCRPSGLVCGGQCPVWSVQALSGRLSGHSGGHLHHAGDCPGWPQSQGGRGAGNSLRGDPLRAGRAGQSHCRWGAPRFCRGADRAGQGYYPWCHHSGHSRR